MKQRLQTVSFANVFFVFLDISLSYALATLSNVVLLPSLLKNPKDVESAVNDRMAQYQAYIEEIGEYYEECGQHINADQDIHTVFECIESIIVNPIPRKN